ncbi:MAG: redoxin domain-containing protein [Planctomycetota bacterium]
MKRYLISFITVLTVLTIAAQNEETSGQRVLQQRNSMRNRFLNMSEAEREKFRAEMQERREQYMNMSEAERQKFRAEMRQRFSGPISLSREQQLKAIDTIEEQVAKLKTAVISIGDNDRGRFQDLSQEERTKLREQMAIVTRERLIAIIAIEQQIAKLKGPGRPPQIQTDRQPPIGEIKAIHDLAVKENATQIADRLQRLIARLQRESRGSRSQESRLRPERLDRPQRQRPSRESQSSAIRAPQFNLNSFDGKTVSLSDYRGKIVVLEWFNMECPFSRYHYETKNTMAELAEKYKSKKVVWLAVNSTNHTTPQANKTFTEKNKLPFPILDDRSGKVGLAYGAKTTPHIFIINPRGRIIYDGAIDDSPMGKKKDGVVNYVDNVLAELTSGKNVSTTNTKPYGCTVKYATK